MLRLIKIKILRNIISRNRKSKNLTTRVTLNHTLRKSLIHNIHLRLKISILIHLQLTSNDHVLISHIIRNLQIHRNIRKRSLKTNPGRNRQIKNKFLHCLLNFLITQIIITNKGSKQSIKITKRLSTSRLTLQSIKEVHHLAKRRPQMFSRPRLNFSLNTFKSNRQQILQIPTHTISTKRPQIMNMHIPSLVNLPNRLR